MNNQEYRFLLAERSELERLLGKIPSKNVIDRMSLQSRLDDVYAELAQVPSPAREPVRAQLTFRGKPVVGSHGIFAEFGSAMVEKFANTLSTLAASLSASLSPKGPIPNRDQHRLLITGIAVGSFGFALEEHMESPQLDLDVPSPVETALEQTRALLQASLESDDETLSEAIAELDPSAIQSLREFLKALADQEATCALTFGTHSFRFQRVEEVRKSMERLSQENLHERQDTFEGMFLGVLPEKRDFEFKTLPENRVIRGKVGKMIESPSAINRFVERNSRITTQSTWVGNAKPRYTLLSFAET